MFTLFVAIIGFIGIGYLLGNKEIQKVYFLRAKNLRNVKNEI